MRALCRDPFGLVLLATLLWSAGPARANDLGDLESLLSEQIVTSASKQAETTSAAPGLSTSLSAEDLRRYGIKTLAEAIDFLTIGVKTSDNLNGGEIGSQGVLLTGDHNSHFLLLVDGHVMNEPLLGSTWFGVGAGIPLELVDHIEVIVGPGSVLYGSNAMFGLISVVTKRAKDNAGLHLVAESALATSVRAGAGYAQQFSLLGREAELTVHGEYYQQAGPYMVFGPVNTGIDAFTGSPGVNARDGLASGVWGGTRSSNSPFAEVPTVMLRFLVGNVELDYHETHYSHAAPTGQGNYDDPGTRDTEVRRSVDLKYHRTISASFDLSARLYGDYFSFRDDMIASRGSLCPYTNDHGQPTCDFLDQGSAMWAGLEVQTSWDWLHDGRLVTMAGADPRWLSLHSSHDELNVDTGASFLAANQQIPGLAASEATIGAYLQQTWTPMPALHFNGGLRVDTDSRFPAVLVKRLSGNWEAWKNGLLKLAYAEAFRAPSWDESNDSAAGRIAANVSSTPNGEQALVAQPGLSLGTPLRPETVKSIDASVQQKFGSHRLLVNGFFARWEDMVELNQLSGEQTAAATGNGLTAPAATGTLMTQYQNAGTINNYGINLDIDGSFGFEALHYGLSATWARASTSGGQAALANPGMAQVARNDNIAPSFFGNARVAYVCGGSWPTLALATQFMGQRQPDRYLVLQSGSTLEPYAPAQVETRLTVSGVVPKVRRLSYRLAADYAVANRGPYTVGPLMVVASSPSRIFAQTPPQLIPVDQFRVTLGLQLDF